MSEHTRRRTVSVGWCRR